MRYRTFGPTGVQVSVIGQGTWNMEKDDRRSAITALRRGLDAGMNHVDTAELRAVASSHSSIRPRADMAQVTAE